MIKYLLSNRFARYLIVGGLNTLFGFFVYSMLIILDLPTWVALLVGNAVGIAFNFFTTGGMVFRDLSLYRAPLFVLCYLAIYFVNLELIDWMIPVTGGRIAAQAILALPMALLSYLMLANIVYRKKNSS